MDGINKEELKSRALLERVANLTAEYEEKVADLRVELTVIAHERDQLKEDSNNVAPEED